VLVNARGGRTSAGRVRRVARAMLTDAGIPHEIVVTRSIRTLRRRASAAARERFTEVACAGGDGTISLVAREVRDQGVPIAVIPCGTGNLLAKHLGVPLLLRPAIRALIESDRLVAIDAIERDDGLSILNLSMGVSSLTMADVDTPVKRVLGTLTYVVGVLVYLVRRNPARFRITVDGEVHRVRAREVLVSNAGFRRTAVETFFAHSDPGDGVLECAIFLPAGLRGAVAMVRDVLRHRAARSNEYMITLPVRESVALESDPPLPIQADGDQIASGRTVARVRRRAIRVRVPAGG